MQTREDSFTSRDGLSLFERAWLPTGDPRAVVAIIHGFAEHSGRYEHVAEALTARGYAVESLDLRGHGRSEGDRATVKSFGRFLSDLRRFLERVRGRHPGKPLFLLGHSMGGSIVTLYTIHDKPAVDGIILSGPGLVARDALWKITAPVFSTLGRLFPNMPLNQLDAETVSRDPVVVAMYDNDPLVYRDKMKAGMVRAFVDALNRIQAGMDTIELPMLLMHGTADELTKWEGSQLLYERARSTDKTLKIYDGLAHEILNEPEQDEVIADLLDWLDGHTSRTTKAQPAVAAVR